MENKSVHCGEEIYMYIYLYWNIGSVLKGWPLWIENVPIYYDYNTYNHIIIYIQGTSLVPTSKPNGESWRRENSTCFGAKRNPFDSETKGKHSARSHSIQFERKLKSSCLSVVCTNEEAIWIFLRSHFKTQFKIK